MRLTGTDEPRPQVLLVEDEDLLLEVLQAALDRHGLTYAVARTGDEAVRKAYELQPEIVLLDISLPGQSGLLVAAKLRMARPSPKLVFITALPRGQCDRIASFVGAECVLHKPFAVQKLLATLNRLLPAAQAA